jgi:hypothetical protein
MKAVSRKQKLVKIINLRFPDRLEPSNEYAPGEELNYANAGVANDAFQICRYLLEQLLNAWLN